MMQDRHIQSQLKEIRKQESLRDFINVDLIENLAKQQGIRSLFEQTPEKDNTHT